VVSVLLLIDLGTSSPLHC